MEPLTTTIIATLLWDKIGQPFLDATTERYSNKILEKAEDVLSNLPVSKVESEAIQAELINANEQQLSSKEEFIKYINSNKRIKKIVENKQVNIKVKKGIGVINKIEGDINFK